MGLMNIMKETIQEFSIKYKKQKEKKTEESVLQEAFALVLENEDKLSKYEQMYFNQLPLVKAIRENGGTDDRTSESKRRVKRRSRKGTTPKRKSI